MELEDADRPGGPDWSTLEMLMPDRGRHTPLLGGLLQSKVSKLQSHDTPWAIFLQPDLAIIQIPMTGGIPHTHPAVVFFA